MKLYYRRDIDGLRSVAIVPVALLDAGVEGLNGDFGGVATSLPILGLLIVAYFAEHAKSPPRSL